MRAQFSKTMLRLGEVDPNLVVLVGDIGAFGLRHFAEKCTGRFFNAGIREQAMMGAAAGLALTGFIPTIHSITPFVVERCFEQIKDDFCYHELPGNIVSVGAGLDYAALGGTHHCYSDIAALKSLPHTKIFCPGTPQEFDVFFEQTYRSGSLNYFRLAGQSHTVMIDSSKLKVGKSVLIKEGKDLTLITMGGLLDNVMKANIELSSHFNCEVLYVPSLKPLEKELIRNSVEKTRRVITVEDHSIYGGLGDEIRRTLDGIQYEIQSVGLPDKFIRDYGSFEYLSGVAGIDCAGIVRTAKKMLKS